MNNTINIENPDFTPPQYTNKKLFNDFKTWINTYPQIKEQARIYLNTKEIEDAKEAHYESNICPEAEAATARTLDVQHPSTSEVHTVEEVITEEGEVNDVAETKPQSPEDASM